MGGISSWKLPFVTCDEDTPAPPCRTLRIFTYANIYILLGIEVRSGKHIVISGGKEDRRSRYAEQ